MVTAEKAAGINEESEYLTTSMSALPTPSLQSLSSIFIFAQPKIVFFFLFLIY